MALAESVATLKASWEGGGWGERRGENDYENRERRGEGEEMVVGVVNNSERGVFVAPDDDEHRSSTPPSAD